MFTFGEHRLVRTLQDIPADCKIILLSEFQPPPPGENEVGAVQISKSILKNLKGEPSVEMLSKE